RLAVAGELDRALRVLDFADGICPSSAADSATKRASIKDALRASPAAPLPDGAARSAAALFEQGAEASARGDHGAARAFFERAWETAHPNGRALANAGLEAIAAGDVPSGRRLVSRAIAELELETASAATARGFDDLYSAHAGATSLDGRF